MIEFLRGRVVRADDDAVIVDCGGLGLRARVRDGKRFAGLVGRDAELPAWLAFRPRGADLFAFIDAAERNQFVELIAIPGVGATTALRLLPHHAALTSADATVPEIPGVGPAIRAKVARWVRRRMAAPKGGTRPSAGDLRPLVAALRALGMPAAEAKARAESALAHRPGAPVEDLIRLAVGRKT